jgi:hypothetical protein
VVQQPCSAGPLPLCCTSVCIRIEHLARRGVILLDPANGQRCRAARCMRRLLSSGQCDARTCPVCWLKFPAGLAERAHVGWSELLGLAHARSAGGLCHAGWERRLVRGRHGESLERNGWVRSEAHSTIWCNTDNMVQHGGANTLQRTERNGVALDSTRAPQRPATSISPNFDARFSLCSFGPATTST